MGVIDNWMVRGGSLNQCINQVRRGLGKGQAMLPVSP